MNHIKAIIFDLNGVLIKSPKLFGEKFYDRFGVAVEEFLPVLMEIMAKVRLLNTGDSFIYWKPYLEKWNVNLSKEEFFDFWLRDEKEIPEMIKLVKELKNKRMKIFILSNNFIERANYYDKNFPILKEITDKIYYSWQTGFVKPDIRAYQKILSDFNLKPEECVYFDDKEENIKSAASLGIKSFLFEGINSVRKVFQVSSFKIQDS